LADDAASGPAYLQGKIMTQTAIASDGVGYERDTVWIGDREYALSEPIECVVLPPEHFDENGELDPSIYTIVSHIDMDGNISR
jgi:hypothetical protein